MKPKTMKECPTMYESMEVLRHLHSSVTEENALVSRVRIFSKIEKKTDIFLKLHFDSTDAETPGR